MVRFIIALAAFALAAFTQEPRGVEDPRAFVPEVYRQLSSAAPPRRRSSTFTAASAYARFRRALDEAEGGEDRLSFDWWVNAQDWRISRVSIVEFSFGPDRKVIEAHWTNYDRRDSSRFFFLREDGRWYLDDVVNGRGRGEDGWTLSRLAANGRNEEGADRSAPSP